jgi:hypothetical protein
MKKYRLADVAAVFIRNALNFLMSLISRTDAGKNIIPEDRGI